jgi:ParB-like chromosome segregation protein Spo0J
MNRSKLESMSIDQLVQRFVEIGIAQDDASLRENISQYNRLFDRMQDVVQELKRRDGDQRRALIALLEHPNFQVRLKAAMATLAIVPRAARQTLETIRAANWQPQSMDAGMTLRDLDRGTFKPV